MVTWKFVSCTATNSDFLNEGSSDVQTSGNVGELTFRANGSGDVNFRQLAVKKLDIEMNGSGDTELGEVGSNLVVQINGSGDLNIAKLNSESSKLKMHGSGGINLRR